MQVIKAFVSFKNNIDSNKTSEIGRFILTESDLLLSAFTDIVPDSFRPVLIKLSPDFSRTERLLQQDAFFDRYLVPQWRREPQTYPVYRLLKPTSLVKESIK